MKDELLADGVHTQPIVDSEIYPIEVGDGMHLVKPDAHYDFYAVFSEQKGLVCSGAKEEVASKLDAIDSKYGDSDYEDDYFSRYNYSAFAKADEQAINPARNTTYRQAVGVIHLNNTHVISGGGFIYTSDIIEWLMALDENGNETEQSAKFFTPSQSSSTGIDYINIIAEVDTGAHSWTVEDAIELDEWWEENGIKRTGSYRSYGDDSMIGKLTIPLDAVFGKTNWLPWVAMVKRFDAFWNEYIKYFYETNGRKVDLAVANERLTACFTRLNSAAGSLTWEQAFVILDRAEHGGFKFDFGVNANDYDIAILADFDNLVQVYGWVEVEAALPLVVKGADCEQLEHIIKNGIDYETAVAAIHYGLR